MIEGEILNALQGIVPSCIITCSKAGIPNSTYISQVFYVDENHVAISHQFFNKSIRNIRENSYASVNVINPEDFSMWILDLEFLHSETEGTTFDKMEIQLEAIATFNNIRVTYLLTCISK